MFVRQSKYDAAINLAARYIRQYKSLLAEWNDLVQFVNDQGGRKAIRSRPSPFTDDEITKLINLCHPDKHGGKPMATEMTQKLLQMKGK